MAKTDAQSLLPTDVQQVDVMESKRLLLTEDGNDPQPQIRVRD